MTSLVGMMRSPLGVWEFDNVVVEHDASLAIDEAHKIELPSNSSLIKFLNL
jgi:hypothetical protein